MSRDVQAILVHGCRRDARNSFFAADIQRARGHQNIVQSQGIRSDPPIARPNLMVPADGDASQGMLDLVRGFGP